MEETYVKNVRLFKCLKNNQQRPVKEALFLFKLHNTNFSGLPGTRTELIEKPDPIWVQTTLRDATVVLGCSEKSIVQCMILDMLEATNLFDEEIARTLAREIACYLGIYYRCNANKLWNNTGDDESGSTSNNFSYVFVVDICRTFASTEYSDAKSSNKVGLDDDDKGHHHHNTDVVHHDDAIMNKAIKRFDDGHGHNTVVHRHDDAIMNKAINRFDDDDEEEEEEFFDIVEYAKRWKNEAVSPNDDDDGMPLYVVEVKPLLTLQEMELEEISDGVYTPLANNCTEDARCSICLEEFSERIPNSSVFSWLPKPNSWRIAWLDCGHAFHHDCIFKWLSTTSSCPLCRSKSIVSL